MHELAQSAGVHTCHTHDCMNFGASAADMAQHVVQPTAASHLSHIQVLITLHGVGHGYGLNTRHLYCCFH
jgi:hypothetical protein